MFGPLKEALGPQIEALSPGVRIWDLKKRGISSQRRLCTLKGSSAPHSATGGPKDKALCPENDSLGHKSEGVCNKNPALSAESSLRALNQRAWSLQRSEPPGLQTEGLGDLKTTWDAKRRFWSLKRRLWSLKSVRRPVFVVLNEILHCLGGRNVILRYGCSDKSLPDNLVKCRLQPFSLMQLGINHGVTSSLIR